MKRILWTMLGVFALAWPASAVDLHRAELDGGLGVGSFTQDVGQLTGTGFSWAGRLEAMPSRFVGGEVSYLGLNSGVHTLIPSAGTVLTDRDFHQNQLTADAIAQLPLVIRNRELAPYAFVGVGYARLSTDAAVNQAGLGDANSFAVPVGVGARYDVNDVFHVDGRFTYNFLTNVDTPLAETAGSWTATIDLGAHVGR